MRARGEGLLLVAVALGAVAIQLPIFAHWLSLLDEGYLLAIADDVNRGKVLYRDVYVDAPFPGAFQLLLCVAGMPRALSSLARAALAASAGLATTVTRGSHVL